MVQNSFLYYIENNSAVIVRCYGEFPSVYIPAVLDRYPVCKIAPYCFAEKEQLPKGKTLLLYGCRHQNTVCGNFLQEISFENNIGMIGAYAFYNCRNLLSISLPESVHTVETDAFMNCNRLQTLHLQALPTQPSCLRQVVALISKQLIVAFSDGSRFLFPEYSEELEENTPAHIFSRQLLGIGYRYRRCFSNQHFLIEEYDRTFSLASAEESIFARCRLALLRLLHPIFLTDDAKQQYYAFLQKHLQTALIVCVQTNELEGLRLLVAEFSPSHSVRTPALQEAQKAQNIAAVAVLTQASPSIQPDYDF